jgi:type II secretory pathway component GspD/PulD (secretin)
MFRSPFPALVAPFALLALVTSIATPCAAGNSISLDVRDLDIYDAVRLLSTQGEVNVVLDAAVPHRPVTMRLQNVSFNQALSTLAQTNDLEIVKVKNVLYLGTSDVMNRRYPEGDRSGTKTVVFALRNAVPIDVAKSLTNSLPKGSVIEPDARTSSVIVAGSPVTIGRARAIVAALDTPSSGSNVSVPMRYVKASDALKAVQATLAIVPPNSAFASDQQNEIVMSGSPDFLARASDIVTKVDKPGQQVRYEVRVTDISPSESSNVGFLFGGVDDTNTEHAGSGSTFTQFLANSLAVNATINAMIADGHAEILARPSISSLNNVPASLLVGQQYPIVYFDARTGTQQVQFVNVGVNLNVTPTIGNDGMITTDLETDYSQVTGTIAAFPIVSTRKAQSTLRVHDGETIVIAGLFSDIDSSTLTKVPFLAEIPIIGEIFKNRQRNHVKDEVVFLITPHLVVDGDPANATIPMPTLSAVP